MKTALSFMLALITTTAPHRAAARTEAAGTGRLVLARLHRERLILHAVTGCFGRVRGDGLRAEAATVCAAAGAVKVSNVE